MKKKDLAVALLLPFAFMLFGMNESKPEFKIRGDRDANWWTMGETVKFMAVSDADAANLTAYGTKIISAADLKAGKMPLPAGWRRITGTITDSEGKKVAEKTVGADVFVRDGWNWNPVAPGFYKVSFSAIDEAGRKLLLTEDFRVWAGWKLVDGKTRKLPPHTITRPGHDFAVLPSPTRPAEKIPDILGVVYGPEWSPVYGKLVSLIGFNFVRLHMLEWSKIEKSKGHYDWSRTDAVIAALKKEGIRDFVGNVWGTPRWASSKPDVPGKSVWEDYYAAYAPVNMADIADFLTVLVKRYPEIKTWELWNEPHFPGQSVFWRSSPEEFVAMLKAGCKAIRQSRPDCTVWLGGIGFRYLPFYHKIMELGAGNYFDVLPLHGHDDSPEPFNAVNRRYGVGPKPWVQGEWHQILFKTADKNPPTETQLSHRMLLDFLAMVKAGVERITVWGLRNFGGGCEREAYPYLHANGAKRISIGGFFRTNPTFEPRLPAVVFRNFTDCFAGKITFGGSWAFEHGARQAVLLKSSAGEVLFYWQNRDKPVKPGPELAAAVTAQSMLLDWEGRALKLDAAFRMRPDVIYFLKNPDPNAIAAWKPFRAEVKSENAIELSTEFYGGYRAGRIFSPAMKIVEPGTLVRLPVEHYVPMRKGENRISSPTGCFALGFSPDGMDLLVEVKDRFHVQNGPVEKLWEGDSLQFALDAVGKGRPEDRIEFAAALTDQGPRLWKHFAPMLGGDLPARYTDPPAEVKYGRIEIEKQPGRLVYKIHISRDDIYPLACQTGQPVRFSLLINNNDGQGRTGYLEWASGIGNGKQPREYGTVTPDVGNRKLLGQKDLFFKGSGRVEPGPETTRVTVSAGTQAEMLRTVPVTVTPGAAYRLSFSARGSMKIRAFAGLIGDDGGTTRLDLIPSRRLTPSGWTDFKQTFIIPAGTRKVYVVIFSWKEQGCYEVENFALTTGNYSASAQK